MCTIDRYVNKSVLVILRQKWKFRPKPNIRNVVGINFVSEKIVMDKNLKAQTFVSLRNRVSSNVVKDFVYGHGFLVFIVPNSISACGNGVEKVSVGVIDLDAAPRSVYLNLQFGFLWFWLFVVVARSHCGREKGTKKDRKEAFCPSQSGCDIYAEIL